MMARIPVTVFAACDIGVVGVASHWVVAPLTLAHCVKVGEAVGAEVAAFVFAYGVIALTLIAAGWGVGVKAVLCAAKTVLIEQLKDFAFARDFAVAFRA